MSPPPREGITENIPQESSASSGLVPNEQVVHGMLMFAETYMSSVPGLQRKAGSYPKLQMGIIYEAVKRKNTAIKFFC